LGRSGALNQAGRLPISVSLAGLDSISGSDGMGAVAVGSNLLAHRVQLIRTCAVSFKVSAKTSLGTEPRCPQDGHSKCVLVSSLNKNTARTLAAILPLYNAAGDLFNV
jgi:hypothetical protein